MSEPWLHKAKLQIKESTESGTKNQIKSITKKKFNLANNADQSLSQAKNYTE